MDRTKVSGLNNINLCAKKRAPSENGLPGARRNLYVHDRRTCRRKPCSCTTLQRVSYEMRDRLESCSRDPIGYVDGASLYRAYFVPNGVDPTGMQWTIPFNDEWWDHYYDGGGEHLDLADTDTLYDAWSGSGVTSGAESSFKSSLGNKDFGGGGYCGETIISGFALSLAVDYAPGNWQVASLVFPIGNTTLRAEGKCVTMTTCDDTVLNGETSCEEECRRIKRKMCVKTICSGKLILSDAFKDAKDIGDRYPGDQEFSGGTAYTFGATMDFEYSEKSCDTSIVCER